VAALRTNVAPPDPMRAGPDIPQDRRLQVHLREGCEMSGPGPRCRLAEALSQARRAPPPGCCARTPAR
jgi:hypothetical protein